MYVYPTDVIKQNAEKRIKKAKVDFVSYMKIGKQHNKVKGLYDIIKKQKYDLIIFDEIHHMGAKFVKETLDELTDETPLCKLGKSTDIANAVLFLADEKASFITGQVLSVNGGILI